MRLSFALLAFLPLIAFAAPRDAERFTHLSGVNLSDIPAFEELQKQFGASPVIESGDAGDYDARVCYRASDKKTVVEFFHGEVNWGFVLRLSKASDKRCPTSNAIKPKQLSVAEIRLGIEESTYRQLMGSPKKETANHLEHDFQYVRTLTDTELSDMVKHNSKNGYPPINSEDLRRWDVGINIRAFFSKGRLASFTVDRVETN